MEHETPLITLRYQLTPNQMQEALQWILHRWGKRVRTAATPECFAAGKFEKIHRSVSMSRNQVEKG